MLFLIDGYNLLHAVGWAPKKIPTGKLEAARRKLLDWLADTPAHKAKACRFRVVFDAQKGPVNSPETTYRSVRVRFAYRSTADDVIEELLNEEHAPAGLTVVSNDARVRDAARRAGATGWKCPDLVDWLTDWTAKADPTDPDADEKPTGPPPPEEAATLLKAFEVSQPKRTKKLK